MPIKQQVYHTCIRCRLLSYFLNKVFFVRFKSILIPFGEHVCMYFSVHTGACTFCPFSAYTQRADHENFRGFCVYNVGLCREMVSSLKFNVWFQGHRMMNTTFWLWITTKKRYLIMMMATHNRKSFCCVLLSTQDNAYVASYSWVCSIDIVVVRSLI